MVEGEDSFSQEQQWPEVRTYQDQSPQQNLRILIPEIYSHIHPAIKCLFPPKEFQKFPQTGHLKYCLEKWEKPTTDRYILNTVKGYQIPFLSVLVQKSSPSLTSMTPQEKVLVDPEVEKMLKKVAIKVAQQDRSLFFSSIFVVLKRESGHHPVINLKNLNHYLPYSHSKMEALFLLKEILQEGEYMCKIDLKDAYFLVPLNQKFQKFVSFKWKNLLYQFLCL